ncbi:hypothetical protein Sala_0704 [Sphingopyxis alaskensis RB2256]|uniref:Uncharacterized protein n=1 Tax=Sphingopyxis alaskensis (strain DSM 13593 / LMG 18877 / RB2256) TaxID=317655 RepID=Q1GV97_SPHAL|nr:hypothetical protein Sala_0704 [Sphingopyxis alaskensis RB2256]
MRRDIVGKGEKRNCARESSLSRSDGEDRNLQGPETVGCGRCAPPRNGEERQLTAPKPPHRTLTGSDPAGPAASRGRDRALIAAPVLTNRATSVRGQLRIELTRIA